MPKGASKPVLAPFQHFAIPTPMPNALLDTAGLHRGLTFCCIMRVVPSFAQPEKVSVILTPHCIYKQSLNLPHQRALFLSSFFPNYHKRFYSELLQRLLHVCFVTAKCLYRPLRVAIKTRSYLSVRVRSPIPGPTLFLPLHLHSRWVSQKHQHIADFSNEHINLLPN